MSRIYLLVPPEDNAVVAGLGAQRDTATQCWYVESGSDMGPFSRWIDRDDDEEEEELNVSSGSAHVAAAVVNCRACDTRFEAICIHCFDGEVSGEPLSHFTVSDIWGMDDSLTAQLRPWPTFRRTVSGRDATGDYANHCPRCQAVLDDLYLHCEPEDPFFDVPRAAAAGRVKLTALSGTVRLGGSEHFEV